MDGITALPKITNYEMAFHAMLLAYADKKAFTVQGFCERFTWPVNRHTRGLLNNLVKWGVLQRKKCRRHDGKLVMVYAKDFIDCRKVIV